MKSAEKQCLQESIFTGTGVFFKLRIYPNKSKRNLVQRNSNLDYLYSSITAVL